MCHSFENLLYEIHRNYPRNTIFTVPVGRDPGTEDYICRGQDNPTGTHLIGKEMYRYYEGSYLAQKP